MFEALKGTGVYPKRAVVCTCYSPQDGYWYVVETGGQGLAELDPMARAKRIVQVLPKLLGVKIESPVAANLYADRETYTTLCSLVDADGCNLHTVQAQRIAFEGGVPGAEATCRRLVELLNGAQ